MTNIYKSKTTKAFPTETLRGILYDDLSADEGFELVGKDEMLYESRWSIAYQLVFREPGQPTGEAWSCEYRSGTGDSGERPFEHDGESVDCTLVKAVERVVVRWEDVVAESCASIANEDASS